MNQLIEKLKQFGLETEEAEIYLYLVSHGEKTALELSRELKKGRTKVYRLVDVLYEKKLVYHKLESRGLKFGAYSSSHLELLLEHKKKQLEEIEKTSAELFQEIQAMAPFQARSSDVLYYKGKKGLEQITWNSTKAQGKLYIYELNSSMDAFLDHDTSEMMRQELLKNKVQIYQLTNLKHIPPHTDVHDLVANYWQVKYIPKKELNIKFEVMIYNDVYAMYSYQNNDIFCVEIYNANLAAMQKQLFNFIWKNAKKMKIVGERGEARI